MSLKLVSLNIERSKHLDRIFPFLETTQPEVTCILELPEREIPKFEKVVGPLRMFALSGDHPADPPEEGDIMCGLAIFSRLPSSYADARYYLGSAEAARTSPSNRKALNEAAICCDVEKDGQTYRIVTTHFTWSPRGEATDEQRQNLEQLFLVLEDYKQFVFCGDLNAPRGGEVFAKINDHYHDNIPPHYRTSIDINLHTAGKLRPHELVDKMVDGLFTTTDYSAENVTLVFGVSDHAAVVADISKAR